MRKIHFKQKTLVIWSIVLGLISLGAIALVVIGALLKANIMKEHIPSAAMLIPGLILAPWTIPLFILVTITNVKKRKQVKDPSLIDPAPRKKTTSTHNHAIDKMHRDSVEHTKRSQKGK